MSSYRLLTVALLGAFLLAACLPGGPAPATQTAPAVTEATATVTTAPATATSAPPTDTTAPPTATATQPTPTTAAPTQTSASPTSPAGGDATPIEVGPDLYIDNRSSPVTVLASYYNAINRREYLRAWWYWENPEDAGTLEDFTAGFEETDSVELTVGPVGADAGAGQLYYSVAAALEATTTGGATQNFVGCFVLHVSQPAVQASPPFRPLGIRSAEVREAAAGEDLEAALQTVCAEAGFPAPPFEIELTPDPLDPSADNYLDDRSGPIELLRSLFNAINRREYLRAWSYWEEGSGVAPFPEFEAGYQNTDSVDLTTGEVVTGAAAGSAYYSVPVTLVAQTTSGETQTFVGCYVLRLGSPSAQAAPPFRSMGVNRAEVMQVDNSADTEALMSTACEGIP